MFCGDPRNVSLNKMVRKKRKIKEDIWANRETKRHRKLIVKGKEEKHERERNKNKIEGVGK